MEEELILQQPADRRLGDNNALPPGPPGVELEAGDLEDKSAPPSKILTTEKEKSISDRSSRRRSPSGSPIRKRKTPSRTRRSPSPPVRSRGRRSPSPRRNRFRDYSPDRRPRYGGRRSPDRRRSPIRRGGGRYRGRGRSSSRSISRSPSPPPRRGGSGRWSPKKKPKSPPQQQPPPIARQIPQPPPATNQPPPQYGVMAPPPPQLYGGEAYGPPPGYNQYGVPPPQAGFVQPNDAYVSMQAQNTGFNTAYPPPGTWSVDAYGQQQWLPPPTQMQQMPPPPQQQPPPPMVVTQNAQPVPTNVPPPTTVPTAAVLSKHVTVSDEAPGTVDPNPQHDAVAQEAENQRDELKKQRTSYLKKTAVLKKELKMLKEQRKDLHSGGAPASPTTKGFIEENEKLQNQIQKKLSTIENVIDMLTGIIGEENLDKDDENLEDDDILKEAALSSLQKPHGDRGSSIQTTTSVAAQKKKLRTSSSSSSESSSGSSSSSSSESSSSETETPHNKEDEDDDSSPERLKKKVIESMKNKDKEVSKVKQEQQKGPNKKERFNYVFYDPEMHWCQTCNVFPKTAKDFLNHLHTKNHMDRESIDTPWHTDMVTDQFPAYENAPTKRTPIRGLTFFVPATAWFCKLCNIWMGDLHCASTHLKSQLHANRYNYFLEENPHYEVNWLADRQIALNEQKLTPLPQQITSVSTTAAERKKLKKDDDKTNKKRKKKSDKKQKKKKKKSNKKRKKDSDSTSSTSSDSSSSTDSDEPKKKKSSAEVKDNLDNPNPAVSIRLSMRKQENIKIDDSDVAPPPPPLKTQQTSPMTSATALAVAAAGGKWTVVQEGFKHKEVDRATDADDSIIQQWNTVQPVISESEKKLLEQLKGKLKNKSKDEQQPKSSFTAKADNEKENRDRDKDKDKDREKNERDSRNERDRGGRDRDSGRGRDDRERRTERRSRTRSPTRSRSRGRDYRRNVRRSLSRNRGRMSPRGWRNNRNRRGRSRSRSPRRRSRSNNDRRRRGTRSRSRSTSRSGSRVEKPVVRPAEFRPRVPEKDKEKDKKTSESKDKKDKAKPKSSSSTAAAANAAAGKKLPFIGKMPVFKKQTSGAPGENEKRPEDQQNVNQQAGPYMYNIDAANAFVRPPAPTAAQIQMAMMEDVYGNAPPFHPDAGMMVDYDDLMPDPVQFVNIMGQAPPPPPPQATEDDKDILPPGIDMEESEEFVPKPITDGPPPGKGPLPKDLEDALNIIFPGERKPGDESDTEEGGSEKLNKANGETQIINDEAVIKPEELAKDGIHLVTFEETSQLGLDEASQMSMNEPLQFNRPPSNPTNNVAIMNTVADMDLEDANSQNILNLNMADIVPPPPPETETFLSQQNIEIETEIQQTVTSSPPKLSPSKEEPINTEIIPDIIPMPTEVNCESELNISVEIETTKEEVIKEQVEEDVKEELEHNNFVHNTIDIDLADIPQPPPSPTESEKKRRQEELNDLAMLGIDADDMAAQCM